MGFIITDSTVTVRPRRRARAMAPSTRFQLPGPRKASWADSVGKSIETSTSRKALSVSSEDSSIVKPFDVNESFTPRPRRPSTISAYRGWSPFSPVPRLIDRTGSASQTRATCSGVSSSTLRGSR